MKSRLLALAVGVTVAGTASAAPFAPFDVRASGMGGTGVASAKAASAALFNPAMLSAQVEGDKFQFVFGAGAQAADEDEMFDQIDNLETTIDALDQHIATIQGLSSTLLKVGTPGVTAPVPQFQTAATSGLDLAQAMHDINGDTLIVGMGAGLGIGVPGPKLGVGVMVSASAHMAATPNISAADVARVQSYALALQDGVVTYYEALANSNLIELQSNNIDFKQLDYATSSTANGTAIALMELGIGLSHRIDMANGGWVSIGATPKVVEASTFDYTAAVDSFEDSDIDSGTYETTDTAFDLDLGVVYRHDAASPWQYGLAVRNVVGNEYQTIAGRVIEVAPQVRAGVSRMTKRTTLAVDLDVTENDGIVGGQATQFLALGAEYDLKYLQLRAGYRANIADSDVGDVATVGLGLGPVDLTAVASEETVGAYLQLGFGW